MDRPRFQPLCGLLNLNKPAGMTSRAAVDWVSRPLRGVRAGHAGTLDPLASGVLIVAVGAATRLIEYIQKMPKTYRTVIHLGVESDTHDAEGRVVDRPLALVPSEEAIRVRLAEQVGTIQQVPPQFSALKVGGQRAYDLARAGRAVDLAARPVRIDRIDLISYAWPRLELEIECGGGTYVRSIARDLGDALGCGGLVEVLTRTRIGPFLLTEAVRLEAISAETIHGLLRPAIQAVADLPRITLSEAQVKAVRQGQSVRAVPSEGLPTDSGDVALIAPSGNLVAIAYWDSRSSLIAPRRVLAES
jgi:tRNA pseudouridine55 synthase